MLSFASRIVTLVLKTWIKLPHFLMFLPLTHLAHRLKLMVLGLSDPVHEIMSYFQPYTELNEDGTPDTDQNNRPII